MKSITPFAGSDYTWIILRVWSFGAIKLQLSLEVYFDADKPGLLGITQSLSTLLEDRSFDLKSILRYESQGLACAFCGRNRVFKCPRLRDRARREVRTKHIEWKRSFTVTLRQV